VAICIVVAILPIVHIYIRIIAHVIITQLYVGTIITIEFFNEIVDVSGVVGLFSEDVGTGTYLLNEDFCLLAFAHFNTLLDDIIAVPVLHHLIECSTHLVATIIILSDLHELINDVFAVLFAAVLQTLLHYVACKFVIAQFNDSTLN